MPPLRYLSNPTVLALAAALAIFAVSASSARADWHGGWHGPRWGWRPGWGWRGPGWGWRGGVFVGVAPYYGYPYPYPYYPYPYPYYGY
jgi:hypothetical protein